MTQKQSHTGMFRAISVILSIVFMWGFGIMLLIVILNCALGYSDNKADFRTMFLSMTETKEEPLVESYLQKAGLVKDKTYFKEMYIHEIESKWGIDLSSISNNGGAEKRFDFVVKGKDTVYGIETNFYTSSGSKLNETARSYKTITMETKDLGYFKFVWFTDGWGWGSARNNLKETFDVLEDLYSISDLENGIVSQKLK